MPIECPKCYSQNLDTASSCAACGERLISTGRTDSTTIRKPPDLPEAETLLPSPPKPTESMPYGSSVWQSRVKPGMPSHIRHVWRWYVGFALVVGLLSGSIVYLNDYNPSFSEEFLAPMAFFGSFALIIGLPVVLWLARPSKAMGVVTNVRQWSSWANRYPLSYDVPGWVFDLRLVDKQGKALSDTKGFTLPPVQVEYSTTNVHGPSIEEGSPVVVRGKWIKDRLYANNIWNCSQPLEAPVQGTPVTYYGQVIGVQMASVTDPRYGGQKTLQVLDFRLQQTDQAFQLLRDRDGNLLSPLPVEIRAEVISNLPQDGDKVEARGQMTRGMLYAREILNHSAGGASIVVKGWAGMA